MSKEQTSDKKFLVPQSNDICEEANSDQNPCNAPAFMSAVVRRQYLQQMIKSFPADIQNRVIALKNIQLNQLKYEAEFYEDVYKLECKYNDKYQPLFEARKKIVTGEIEPSKEAKQWKEEDSKNIDLNEIYKKKECLLKFPTFEADVKGIPNFWLTIFRNTEILCEMVQEHDEPVFKKLIDIKIKYESKNEEHSYILEFLFDKNEYFKNSVLTKQYFLKARIDDDYPFAFEGPEIFKCKGCVINWFKGMNLTIKTIHKKQKHKERGVVRSITKQVPNDSFFNFFSPPETSEDQELDEESQGILATDFEIGHFLRARIIPKAVLYFTGDIVDDGDDDMDYGEEEEEEEEDPDVEDENSGSQFNVTAKKETPNECPNQ